MSNLFWNALKVCPTVLGATLLAAGAQMVAVASTDTSNSGVEVAQATPAAEAVTQEQVESSKLEQIQGYSNSSSDISADDPMGQITNASQFRDVQPSDWAFEALDRIVQRYGCLVGYPDGTYRGNRALSRYEFAAGLNACLRQIETLIANQPGGVSRTDFEALQRLTEEFRTELATLGTRIDNLEGRTAFLETRQFSTTTKLVGEAIIAVSDVFGDEFAQNSPPPGTPDTDVPVNVNTILSNRVRINFDSSFTGKDRLRTRIQARNTTPFNDGLTGTNMTRLGFDGNEGNNVNLHRLQYRFPLGSQANVFVEATGTEFNDNLFTFNPFHESAASGSISRFGRFNPIYRQSREGAGLTLDYKLSNAVGLALAYAVPLGPVNPALGPFNTGVANDPRPGFGLFDGSYSALAQLSFRPTNAFNVGLTYAHSYNTPGNVSVTAGTGSTYANQPFGNTVATSANHYGVQASLQLSPSFVISGWGGFTNAIAEQGAFTGRDADIWNYAVTFAFPDFGKKGNLLGLVAGVPPRAAGNANQANVDRNVSYHLEGFFRYRVTDNIEITPGVFVILNPEHNKNNDPLYVGTIRTTFKF